LTRRTVYFYCCYFILLFICTPLSTVAFQRSHQCYHYVIQSLVFSGFYCSPVRVAIRPDDESLLLLAETSVSFSKFYNSWTKTYNLFVLLVQIFKQ